MGRWLKIVCLSCLVAASFPALAEDGGLTNAQGRPMAEPFAETVFGIRIDDPYRWMEDIKRQGEMAQWIKSSSAHTVAELAKLPGRARIAQNLQAISRAGESYQSLQRAGARTFFLRLDADSSIARLYVREAGKPDRILIDPGKGGGKPSAINNFTPSPSGALLAYHVADGGGEVGVMRFLDVATGKPLAGKLEPIWGEFSVSWIGEDRVLYTRMNAKPGADQLQNMDVRLHVLGSAQENDRILLSPGNQIQPVEFPSANASVLSDWTLAFASGARADARVLAAKKAGVLAGKPDWKVVAGYDDRINGTDVRGDSLFVLTTKSAPNGEILRVDLNAPDLAKAEKVLPSSDLVLTGVFATRDGLYVVAMKDGESRLLYLKDGKGPAQNVALPFGGTSADISVNGDRSALSFGLAGWVQNRRYFEARGGTLSPLGVESPTYAGAAKFEVYNEQATSADGTSVPMFVLTTRGQPRDAKTPAIILAYGSYGISQTPSYAPNIFAWLEEGGVFAICAVRGGGEKGRAWHEAGRERNKPNGHADFIACAEKMIALGWTSPKQLGATGVSAGGLLAPPAALMRPDLFAAVVPRVAILNPTRLAAAENGPNQYAEMGDPNTADGFKALFEQDSYHWLTRAKSSPDWYLTVGLNDRRVEPWMSAKFAARALAKFGTDRLVLVRTDPDAGHGIGSTRDQVIEERADIYAFFLNRFGAKDFQVPAQR